MLLFILLFRIISAAMFLSEDRLCDPGERNISPYTGFRVYRRYSYGWPILHHWHIVHCKRGKVDLCEHFVASRSSNFPWNTTLCLGEDRCYRFARRKRYAQREVPVFISNIQVGGIYTDDGVPLLPVLAAKSTEGFQFRSGGRLVKYVPVLYTPDFTNIQYPHSIDPSGVPKWAKGLLFNETYDYNGSERKAWYKANKMINGAANLMSVNEKYIPWEFDASSHEFSRNRIRDRLRCAIQKVLG